jgi:hypothetical protein
LCGQRSIIALALPLGKQRTSPTFDVVFTGLEWIWLIIPL